MSWWQGGRRPPFIGGSKTSRWTSTNHGTTTLRAVLPWYDTTVPGAVLPPCGSTTPLLPPLVPQATEGSAVLGAVVRCGTTAERYYRDPSGTTVVGNPGSPGHHTRTAP